jgi:hypothetical protein
MYHVMVAPLDTEPDVFIYHRDTETYHVMVTPPLIDTVPGVFIYHRRQTTVFANGNWLICQ